MSVTLNKSKDELTIKVPFNKKGFKSGGEAKATMHVSFHQTLEVEGAGPLKIGLNVMLPKSGIPFAERKAS